MAESKWSHESISSTPPYFHLSFSYAPTIGFFVYKQFKRKGGWSPFWFHSNKSRFGYHWICESVLLLVFDCEKSEFTICIAPCHPYSLPASLHLVNLPSRYSGVDLSFDISSSHPSDSNLIPTFYSHSYPLRLHLCYLLPSIKTNKERLSTCSGI